jgi:cell division protein ZapA
MSRQVEVQIMGQSYLLALPEGGEQRLLDAVAQVDQAMVRIRNAGKLKARDRIAVLAALNIAFDSVVVPAGQATPSPAAQGAASVPADGAVQAPRVAQLIERLDRVLDDGQLL